MKNRKADELWQDARVENAGAAVSGNIYRVILGGEEDREEMRSSECVKGGCECRTCRSCRCVRELRSAGLSREVQSTAWAECPVSREIRHAWLCGGFVEPENSLASQTAAVLWCSVRVCPARCLECSLCTHGPQALGERKLINLVDYFIPATNK